MVSRASVDVVSIRCKFCDSRESHALDRWRDFPALNKTERDQLSPLSALLAWHFFFDQSKVSETIASYSYSSNTGCSLKSPHSLIWPSAPLSPLLSPVLISPSFPGEFSRFSRVPAVSYYIRANMMQLNLFSYFIYTDNSLDSKVTATRCLSHQ